MSQKEIEVILTRQLAGYLAMPIFIVDTSGTLLFYNEPAESILGQRFEETGELSKEELAKTFAPMDIHGAPIGIEKVPVILALEELRPVHESICIRGLDGVVRRIDATAFPLIGQGGRLLGALSIFWESRAAKPKVKQNRK
jgi:PAS domain-containing protein